MTQPVPTSIEDGAAVSDLASHDSTTPSKLSPWRRLKATSSHFGRNLSVFFREVWPSIVALAVVGAVTGGVYKAPHAFDRPFPITFYSTSRDIVWPQFAYPYREQPFSSLLAAILVTTIPISVILFTQTWVRSFYDAANAILGLTYAMVTGTFIIVVLKKTIGGLRPHFLSVCEPIIPGDIAGSGFQNIMFTIEQVCTGTDKKKIGYAIESFPSGHAEALFAGFVYLSIYLSSHLGVQSEYRVSYWRMIACVLPILLATYLSSFLVLTYHHHHYDVVFGALIGILVALFGYRMMFRSVWNGESNAVPSLHNYRPADEGKLPR